jgi:hypothetical protein
MKLRINELDFDVLFLKSSALDVVVCFLGFTAAGRLDDNKLIYLRIYYNWILFLLGDLELKRREGPPWPP